MKGVKYYDKKIAVKTVNKNKIKWEFDKDTNLKHSMYFWKHMFVNPTTKNFNT